LSRWRARLTEHDPVSGSHLNQAQQRLGVALQGASQAADRAALARRRAALAHDGAAALHEQLAARGIGDVSWHEQQGRRHRAAAEADRQRANVLLTQPLSGGTDARSA
jgi:hypothetical protein